MTDIDDRVIPKVLSLAEKYGKQVTWSIPSTQTYDPATGHVTDGSDTDHTIYSTPPESYKTFYVDGDLIKLGDTKTVLPSSGLSFTPKEGQRVTVDSITWRVVSVGPIYSGTSIAAYEIQLRT